MAVGAVLKFSRIDFVPMSDPVSTPSPPTISPKTQQGRQSERLMMLVVRLLFLVLLMTVTLLTVSSQSNLIQDFRWPTLFGLLMAAIAVGTIVIVVDAMTPNKRLSSVVAAYLGICLGLIGAVAFGALIDVVTSAWELEGGQSMLYLGLGKVIFGIVLCYFSVSIVLTTKDDFRLVLPYVEFSRQVRGIRPLLVDTSTLIDGRINDLGLAGFIDAPLLVGQFILDELQALADSSDKLKRDRGRHGLDMLSKLQEVYPDTRIETDEVTAAKEGEVDRALIETARREGYRLITTDAALAKIAKIQSVAVLNINDVAGSLRLNLFPGDELEVEIVRKGDAENQGVGYLPDGTMIIIDNAADQVGESIQVCITNTLQRAGGKLVFGRLAEAGPGPGNSQATAEETEADMARAATTQPRSTDRPEHPATGSALRKQRNPRRRK